MEISSYELVEFLTSLPRSGLVELSLSDNEVYLVAETGEYQAVGENNIKIKGRTAYGMLTADQSEMLIDIDEIKYIRHTPDLTR